MEVTSSWLIFAREYPYTIQNWQEQGMPVLVSKWWEG